LLTLLKLFKILKGEADQSVLENQKLLLARQGDVNSVLYRFKTT